MDGLFVNSSLRGGAQRRRFYPGSLTLFAAFFLVAISLPSSAIPLRKSLATLSVKDTLCKVWVVFTDKSSAGGAGFVSEKAQKRRLRAGVREQRVQDMPVSHQYVADVERLGGRCVNIFTWANAASFVVPSKKLDDLAQQRFVRDLVLVRSFPMPQPYLQDGSLRKSTVANADSLFGFAFPQLSILNVPAAHRFIKSRSGKNPGEGILIGVFDSGFRLGHRCLNRLFTNGQIFGDSDFVDKDGTVQDPDSVVNAPNDSNNLYFGNDIHGSQTLSCMAGYDPGRYKGDAWGAQFVLARTEDNQEHHVEEDNWAAAVVWAEGLGVDIVSSSLGYRSDFTPPDTDYTYQDMDGKTTIVSKAAREAVRLGMIVVNSVGNEGARDSTLSAPADVDGVVGVGAVDSDLRIAGFSSGGPSADGRLKPDVVAPGVAVVLPSIYGASNNSYTSGSGTSFSAPLVAGVCALILQSHDADSSTALRERLYSSCFFVPGQTAANNTYGRGVPDALLACLDYNQTYITVTDSFLQVVPGAIVMNAAQKQVGVSDSSGYAVVSLTGVYPETLMVSRSSSLTALTRVVIQSRHSREKAVLPTRYALTIFLRDTAGNTVVGKVYWKNTGDASYSAVQTDSTGYVLLTNFTSSSVEMYGVGKCYFNSAQVSVALVEKTMNTATLVVKPRPVSQFVVFPNVINIAGKRQRLHMEFCSQPDDPRRYSQLFTAAIRSIDGGLVWEYSKVVAENECVAVDWPQNTDAISPGMYYFIVKYGGKSYKRKFLVIG
jgi:serine protease AprX